MAVQFISTNKNYKRLFNAPLDPTMVWETEIELREYLKDPTCYINQVVGCNGKAYIIIDDNGTKDIKEIGTISGDNNGGGTGGECELDKQLSVSVTTPTGNEIIWFDLSDVNNGYTSNISDLVINEFREMFLFMQEQITNQRTKILELEARVIYLEENGGGSSGGGGDTGGTGNDTILTLEDGSVLTLEDGSVLILETQTITSSDVLMTLEDNSTMILEDNSIMIL